MKKLVILSASLLIAFAAQATDFWSNNLRYSINPDGKSVTVIMRNDDYRSLHVDNGRMSASVKADSSVKKPEEPPRPIAGDVVIPEKVDYEGKQYMVTIIGSEAFFACNEILSITIPQSVTVIHSFAIEGCSALTSLLIPKNVSVIGNEAFSGCRALTQFVVEKGNLFYSAEDGVLFTKNIDTIVCYPNAKATSYILPSGVTTIGDFAFAGCDLVSVTIPESVTSIGANAFYFTRKLDALTIPKSVITIGKSAFAGCGLTTLTIPGNITKIEDLTFSFCRNLTSLTIPESVTSIADNAFYFSKKLKEIHYGKRILFP